MESHPPARAARVSSLASTHQGQGIPAKHRAIHPNLHTTIPPMPVVFPVANLSNTTASTSSAAAPGAKTSDGWAKARGRPALLFKIGDTDHGHRVGGKVKIKGHVGSLQECIAGFRPNSPGARTFSSTVLSSSRHQACH
jgi:hypothetical protein